MTYQNICGFWFIGIFTKMFSANIRVLHQKMVGHGWAALWPKTCPNKLFNLRWNRDGATSILTPGALVASGNPVMEL